MFKNQENKGGLGISNSKNQGIKFPQKKVKPKDLGNISLDISKEEEIMRKTPGLMENSMIENITKMNSIFAQKQSERLMLNNFNQLNINDSQNNTLNSNQTFNQLVNSNMSGPSVGENPLDMAVIIKDSSEVKEEEAKEHKKKKKNAKKKRKGRKKKKTFFNKVTILIIFLLIIIVFLIIGLVMTYISVAKDR